MSKEEMIYDYLINYHRGKFNLIKNKDLRDKFKISDDKSLRQIIQNIRESKDFEKIVGSISGRCGGFYICETVEEIKETIGNFTHRANQMLRMAYVIKRKMKRGRRDNNKKE